LTCVAAGFSRPSAQSAPAIRLYVFDGGVLESDPARYRLKPGEVKTSQLSIAAYLIVHPRGTLMWDTGAIPDDSWTPTGSPVLRRFFLSNGQERRVTIRAPLEAQLKAAGFTPDGITYLALSHYHWDHVANANRFAAATWLVPQNERDAMLPAKPHDPPQPSNFAALSASRSVVVGERDHDVFGDGAVVIKRSAGHTPGHQVLYVRLPRTGGVVLSGDLSLPGRADAQPAADDRVQRGGDAAGEDRARGVHEAVGRAAVDPARPDGAREAEEGASVLRLVRLRLTSPRCLLPALCPDWPSWRSAVDSKGRRPGRHDDRRNRNISEASVTSSAVSASTRAAALARAPR
jgi:glyoxylase-like metal-dependent hydrolase (beta-lactamase superfamily II)